MTAPKRLQSKAFMPGALKGRPGNMRGLTGSVTIVSGEAHTGPDDSLSFTGLKSKRRAGGASLKPGGIYIEITPSVARRLLASGRLRLDLAEDPAREDLVEDHDISPVLRAALDDAYRRGDESASRILSQPDMLSSDEIAARFGVTRETANQWRRKGELLGLEGDARGVRYPDWQIVGGRRIPRLRELFGFFGNDPWAVYRFLLGRHDALDDRTGVEAIQAGRMGDVLSLAESIAHGAMV